MTRILERRATLLISNYLVSPECYSTKAASTNMSFHHPAAPYFMGSLYFSGNFAAAVLLHWCEYIRCIPLNVGTHPTSLQTENGQEPRSPHLPI